MNDSELVLLILKDYLIHEPECDYSMYGTVCDCVQKNVATRLSGLIATREREARLDEQTHTKLVKYDDGTVALRFLRKEGLYIQQDIRIAELQTTSDTSKEKM